MERKTKIAILVVIGLLLIAGSIIFTLTLRDVNANAYVGVYCPNCNDYVLAKCQENCPACGQAIPHNLEWKYSDSRQEAGYCTQCSDGEIKSYRPHTLTKKVSSEYYHYYYCENCEQKIGELEEHSYVDGICGICNHPCSHPNLNCSLEGKTHVIVCDSCGIGVNGLAGITEPATVIKYNESQHWKMCTGCWNYLPDTYESHTFDNSPKCTGCDYTCSHSGQTGSACTVCGTTLEQCTNGHTPGSYKHINPGNGEKPKHYQICSVCEKKISSTEAECDFTSDGVCKCGNSCPHSWKDATCTEPKTCMWCGDTTGTANGHTESDKYRSCSGENSLPAHCKYCTVCKVDLDQTREDCSKKLEVDEAVDATCTETGKTEGKHCKECGNIITAQTTTPALDHNVSSWNQYDATQHEGYCSRCEKTVYELHSGEPCSECGYGAHSHDYTYNSVVTSPTCTEVGYTTHYCSCGDNYTDSYIAALDHNWKAATCTEPKTCQRCDETEGNALEHEYKYNDNGDGTHQVTCNRTGCNYSEKETHTYGTDDKCTKCNAVKDTTCSHTPELDKKNPTETQHFYKCTKCGATTKTESHTFENGKCTVCEYECKHPSTTKKKDDTYHWDKCDNCGEKLNKEEHEYENGECECGKIESNKHTHTPKATYEKDDTYHWKICSECGEIVETKEKHEYVFDTNTKCKCGATRHVCNPKSTYEQDSTHHWKICSECGKIVGEKEQHKDENNDKNCDVCGYTINSGNTGNDQNGNDENDSNNNSGNNNSECKHENREWKTEGEEHYQVCKDCGKEIDGTRGKHNFVDGECKNCKTKEDTSNSKLPNTGKGTFIVIATAFIGLAALGAVKMKKYKEI